jgi:6-pyruvoyltetrahydropterin/6-carboxytetrahydropterin synthase
MHGHTYRVEVLLEGTPTEPGGWFVDYALIAQAWKPLHDMLDHRTLNEIEGLENPTTENLCAWVLRKMIAPAFPYPFIAPFVVGIRIYESSTTWCEVTRDVR